MSAATPHSTLPDVSVVVPTYRRPGMLARCLAALLAQTLPGGRYEIIVCDDAPDPAVRALLEQLAPEGAGRPALHYLPVTATQGPAGARNRGWRAARAPVVAFTDDDTVPDARWLEAGLAAMTPDVDAATGRVVMPVPDPPTDYERDAGRLAQAEFVTANCFLRRAVLERLGGFDERYSQAWREDSDLHFSLLEGGCRIERAPDAVVVHPLRPVRFAAGLSMQRKVMFDALLYRKHRLHYRQRIRRRPPWFYLLVTAVALAAPVCLLAGWFAAAAAAAAAWLALTLGFFLRRLRGTALSVRNVADLALTSALIPLLSIFWRLVGAWRFGRVAP
ncbi:glycosyltransferase family 2 protein [Castellaniella defragrans]|uniref:glycosyltransferase family 2 protein n=1 Tax=Castellaniella defragrans TaxID=75697 RepID=UPI0005BA11F4|nr:glycosyltransferase [Castellaniella defragrans]